jgi:hypothetical protein
VNFVQKNFYPGHGKHKVDEKETPALTPIENLKTVREITSKKALLLTYREDII